MIDLIGVPYTSAARPGGIANAVRVLREEGLVEALLPVRDAGDLELLASTGARGPSGLLNERALGRLVEATREAVGGSLHRARLPLLVGGDCPVLLGAFAAGRDRGGTPGRLLVDGHEDAWPPERSRTGEASDSEVAIALGRVACVPPPLDELVPLLTADVLAMLGPRDRRELDQEGVESLAGAVALFRDDRAVRASGAATVRTEDSPAADYLQPDGLGWRELVDIAAPALADPRCFGCSVVIYNPELDPARASAAEIVRFISDLVERAS